MKQPVPRNSSRWVIALLAVWLASALILAALGILMRVPVPPPAIAFSLTAALLLTLWGWGAAREHVRRLGPAPLVGFHVIRLLVGIYFLILRERGVLPGEFATLAAWGDILVGASAALVLWSCIPVRTAARRHGLLAWNTVGLIDILLVLGNGIRLLGRDPALAVPFATFPLALLPLFVLPLVIASHVVLFTWYGKSGVTAGATFLDTGHPRA
jgi:hypothetical protein